MKSHSPERGPLGLVVRSAGKDSADVGTDEAPAVAEGSFAVRYKDWIDEQNRRFEQYGLWNDEFRSW